jgi:hypothetical protein
MIRTVAVTKVTVFAALLAGSGKRVYLMGGNVISGE